MLAEEHYPFIHLDRQPAGAPRDAGRSADGQAAHPPGEGTTTKCCGCSAEGYSDVLLATSSGVAGLIEVSLAGISKGTVIDGLAREWGIAPEHAIAFGDQPNDLEMLRWAGWGVAMENADPG